jgi:hypothetical protein
VIAEAVHTALRGAVHNARERVDSNPYHWRFSDADDRADAIAELAADDVLDTAHPDLVGHVSRAKLLHLARVELLAFELEDEGLGRPSPEMTN